MVNWFQKVIAQQLTDEDFITDDGTFLSADGDAGEYNHDMRAMETILYQSLDNVEELASLNVEDLNQEQLNQIESNFPEFIGLVGSGRYLPKEFAVTNMGWIRVVDNHFEAQEITENTLSHIADYILERVVGGSDFAIQISERSTGHFVSMQFHELMEALESRRGVVLYQTLARQPAGLY